MADGRTRRPKGKKGALVGSGGNNRRRLQGKGPTPKAGDRVYHPAHKRKLAAEATRREQARLEKANRLRPELSPAPGRELIAGRNMVPETVWSGISLSHVSASGGIASDERLGEVVCTTTILDASLFRASRTELDRMVDDMAHQGVAIEVPPHEYADVEDLVERAGKGARAGRPGLVVALDLVTDLHNLGAAACSASAFGANGVVVSERRPTSVNAMVWEVSIRATARVLAARVPNLVAALGKLEICGYFAVGLDGRDDMAIEDISFADAPIVLVTGSEGKGLARLTREACDVIVLAPVAAELESLNVAVATEVALYQIDRLRVRS